MSLIKNVISRGDIYFVKLDPVEGAEIGKTRPCVIIQNDVGNANSPVTIIACITSTLRDKKYPHDVDVTARETGLPYDSRVLLNQIRTISKTRLGDKMGTIPDYRMREIDQALRVSLDL
jgi:mRNA interferase MazF